MTAKTTKPLFQYALVTIIAFIFSAKLWATIHYLPDIKTTVNIYNGDDFDYEPGDTFCIPSDEVIGGLRLINFIGSAEQPLVFTNCGGRVIIEDASYSGISFRESQYIRLTGTGDENFKYGIFVRKTKAGTMGVAVSYLSSDVEIDHIEIANTGFAGIMAKTDPYCEDPATWRRNGYVLRNLHIHHNYIHNTGGEGMYIGFTGGYKVSSNRSCEGDFIFGHWLENVNIHHNRVEDTGWDGIQLSLCRENGQIHHNSIVNYGLAYEKFQNFGLSLGSGDIQLYNNYIENKNPENGSMGFQMIGATSGSYIIGNVIVNTHGYGMFIHNRYEFEGDDGYYILNNTIVNAGQNEEDPRSAIMYNACITLSENAELVGDCQEGIPTYFKNNLIINPGADHASGNTWKGENENYIDFNTKALRDAAIPNRTNNYFTLDASSLSLFDIANNDYRIVSTSSPLYNAGANVTEFPVYEYDLSGIDRVYGGTIDIGAYEYSPDMSSVNINTPPSIEIYPNPVNDMLVVKQKFTGITRISIYDVYGRLHSTQNYYVENQEDISIDVSHLNMGLYVLKVNNTSKLFTKK